MIDYKDIIKQAPLPFTGQKRNFIKLLYDFFNTIDYTPTRVVDSFGGSGLLSNLFKQMYPDCEVVYNDYDGYTDRLKKIIGTNEVLADVRRILSNHNIEKDTKITEPAKKELEEYLSKVDWAKADKQTVYTGFSLKGLNNQGKIYTNKVRQSDYEIKREYLQGCTVVNLDYKELIKKDDSLYVLDPPYIQTNNNQYKDWFSISDFLELYERIKNLDNFILFTSYRSGAYDVLNYLHKDITTFCDHVINFKSHARQMNPKTDEVAYIRLRGA